MRSQSEGETVNTRISGAMRRTGGRSPSHRNDDSAAEIRRHWRTTLAGIIVAAVGMAGLTALAAAPASAEELPPVAVEQSDPATEEATPPAEDPAADAGQPAEESAADPAPAEDPAADPVTDPAEEPAAPAEEVTAPAEETGDEVAEAPETDAPATEDSSAASDESTATVETLAAVAAAPEKIAFCHRTASNTNPYEFIDTSLQAFFQAGHVDHTGPIWPDEVDGFWGDIYPPNIYDPDGNNWTAEGQEIVENGCNLVPEFPTPEVNIDALGCVFYVFDGSIDVSVGNTSADFFYVLLLDGVVQDEGFDNEDIAFSETVDPGTHTVTLLVYNDAPDQDGAELVYEASFNVFLEACPVLDITAEPGDCSTGDDGTVTLSFTGLIAGETYDWSVAGDGYANGGTFVASGPSDDVALVDLPPGDFDASIEWVPGPGVELDPVVAMTTFTVEPCPTPAVAPKPVTPVTPVTPTVIAVTGTDPAPFLSAALLLFGLGGALLLAASRRRTESSRTE